MASFLTDLAKPYVEKLINGAIAESSYICCFTCIAKDFEEEKARLETERSTVKQRVDVATSRGEDVQANALSWEEDADKLIQEDTKTKRCLFGFCPHIIWRYKRGKELTNKKEQIKRLIETGKQLSIGLPARLPGAERYSSQHYIPFKSRESKYKELLEALKDDNNYITGLQGMGGTGKTTLAKQVGKALKESKQYQIIDTTVSSSPDFEKIQDDIAGPLGLKFNDCNESDRPKKLWSRLTNGEKILLILDDVWGDINLDEIGIPDGDNHKGCRILVTTRNLLVCNRLGCSKTIQLDLLSEEDAWIMFQRHAGLSEISPENLLEKGRKIANECKRLPIAIAAIASSLNGIQRPEEWEWTLKSLKKHMPMPDVDDDLVKIYKCLKFSYDNMKNEKAKRLFLLCSVFREDEEIPTERLTRLGIGGGIFGEDYVSYEDARTQVVISKNKLIDSCLLLEADQNRVKMHDLVRDAAQWIANKKIQTVKLYDKNQKAMVEREANIKYLLCEGKLKDVFSFKLDGSKLEILIVNVQKDEDYQNVKIEVPNSFFENITGLRVFRLIHDHYFQVALSLPRSIQSLKNIRSLLFTRVNLGDISILGNLQSLETLDLDDCKIDELPHGITNLEKLKLLNLNHCEIARNNPFEVIEGCSSLEELHFTGNFNGFCKEITFPKLQRFNIGDDSSSVNESSSKYVSFIYNGKVFLSETTLKYCMQEAEVVRLRRMEGGWRNIIPEIVPMDHGMNDLEELFLRHNISQLKCLIDTKHTESQVSKVFSKLVVLDLWNLENLEELCNGPLSLDSLNSLEKLSIKDCKHLKSLFKCNLNLFNLKSVSLEGCPMLISLFQLPTAVSLVLLERLEIKKCGRLEYIIDERKGEESRGEIVDDNSSTSQGSMFQKLEVLSIKKCPELEFILPFLSVHDLPALESITIERCDKLKYIFGKDVQLGSLKKMGLGGIPNFMDIFPECNRTMSLSIKEPSSISGDASEPQEQSEPIKCNIYCCGKKYGHRLRSTTRTKTPLVSKDQPQDNLMKSNSYCLNIWERAQRLLRPSDILCNIKEITLSNISKMKSVFILSIAPIMLLETLKIIECDELKHIIIDTGDHDNNWGTVFPNLRKVKVEDCEKLEYIIGHFNDDDQNYTEIPFHLPVLETFVLHNLPSLISMCPKQYHTTFPPLKVLKLNNCGDGKIIKELSGNIVDRFLALERLIVKNNSKVESIICLNEINEQQQMNLALEDIDLDVLPMMTCLFVGPKNTFFLQNLTTLIIKRCEKLEIVFSTSTIRCLPQLDSIRIEECKELKHIIEDDLENKKPSNVMSTTKTCFPKLVRLAVVKCNKLKYVFPISICKDLPELCYLRIEECNELRHIIEDDLENKKFSNFMSTTKTCFPKLETLVLEKCNKLKYVFPISVCKELPELGSLMIREADELEEIFGSEGDDHKVEIPNLKVVIFENLPSLSHAQRIQFQAVKYRFIQNCQKLSLASASTPDFENDISASEFGYDLELFHYWKTMFQQLQRETKGHDSGNENPSPQTAKDFAVGIEVQTALEHKLTSPQIKMKETPETENELIENVPDLEIPTNLKKLMNEQSMDQQRSLGETDTAVTPSQGIEISVEEGTTSANAKTITTSLGPLSTSKHKTSSQEYGDGEMAISSPISITRPLTTQEVHVNNLQETSNTNDDQVSVNDDSVLKVTSIVEEQFSKDVEFRVPESKLSPIIPSPQAFQYPPMLSGGDPSQIDEELEDGDDETSMTSLSIAATNTNDQVSLNDDAFKKVSSNIEEQFPKVDGIIVSKSKPSPWITSSVASQFPPVPSKGDPSQNVEDLSSSLLVKRELEQLLSKKHLDYENLSLLNDFFVKHPSVLLNDASLSNRYKGYAYNCLAELLKFLQTHSVLDVLDSSHSEFVELLQDARRFPFHKEWLDDIEKRALFPGLQVSQDALQKLLDSKHILAQHVEDLKHQLASSEAVLQNITQQEAQILQTRASLSDPIGY